MKKLKRSAALFIVLILLTATVFVFAAELRTPPQILSDLTDESEEALFEQRAEGETYGALAADKGVIEEFRAAMYERRMTILDLRVDEGKLTQERADEIKAAIAEHAANCDGSGQAQAKIGEKEGIGFGQRSEKGQMARRGGRAR